MENQDLILVHLMTMIQIFLEHKTLTAKSHSQ